MDTLVHYAVVYDFPLPLDAFRKLSNKFWCVTNGWRWRRRELRASRSDLHIANESIAVCTICKSTYIVECIDRNYGPHNVNYGKCSFIEILNYLKLTIKT